MRSIVLFSFGPKLSKMMGDCIYYIHTVRMECAQEPSMHRYHHGHSESEFMDLLECEESYRILREREISEQDRLAIQEFVSGAITSQEWEDFQKHCLENQLNPYQEMRELIYSTYSRMSKENALAKKKNAR